MNPYKTALLELQAHMNQSIIMLSMLAASAAVIYLLVYLYLHRGHRVAAALFLCLYVLALMATAVAPALVKA